MDQGPDYLLVYYRLHQGHKGRFKHRDGNSSGFVALDGIEGDNLDNHGRRRARWSSKGPLKLIRQLTKRDQI